MTSDQEHLDTLTRDTAEAVVQLLEYAASENIPASIVSSARTCEEQMELYAQGRTKPGAKITWAPGCRSWHTHGRAVDLYLGTWDEGPYWALGPYWKAIGGRWGGDFGDYGHFEWHPGISLADVCPNPEGVCSAPGLSAASMVGIGLVGLGAAFLGWTVASIYGKA